ncbi:hypothetical protein [Mycobacteroides abscessus]|uniref:hypothetical protein n=1 Tax=Mycobacteroides abscessus TaxID=36809 RepID=UPI001ED98579|nr:hypothetical protein [Mycobacteroides abscessus]
MAYFLGQRLAELIIFGPIVLLVVWLATRRLRRRPSQQNQWEHAVRVCAADPVFRLGQIVEVLSSDAEQGERARIAWHGMAPTLSKRSGSGTPGRSKMSGSW